jgi:hypothetical protein
MRERATALPEGQPGWFGIAYSINREEKHRFE